MTSPLPETLMRTWARVASPGGRRGRLSILIYHRVLMQRDALNPGNVTAVAFDAQMLQLATHFSVLPLADAVARLGKGSLPPRAACVTFDDGYADNVEVALPILQKHNLCATFFIATDYLDGGRMWNDTVVEAIRVMPAQALDLEAWGLGTLPLNGDQARRAAIAHILASLKYLSAGERAARSDHLAAIAGLDSDSRLMMTAGQVRTLRACGMEIGAHTVTHPILMQTSAAEAKREIHESGSVLSDILREPVRLFAYPNGKPGRDYGAQHVRMVKAAGYTAAVSTAWGVATGDTDVFQLPRFTPWDKTPNRFMLRLVRNLTNRQPETV